MIYTDIYMQYSSMICVKRKIVVFAHDAYLYGASLSLLTIIEGLSQQNFDFLVILPHNGGLQEKLNKINVNNITLSFPRNVVDGKYYSLFKHLKYLLHYYKDYFTVKPQLKSIISQFNPNIIYTNTSVISIGFDLAKELDIPHIWHIREYGTIDYNFKYLPSFNSIRKKIISSQQSVFISYGLREFWKCQNLNKCTVIYNGIKLNVKRELNFNPFTDVIEIGILGAITPGKGQDIAIKSIQLLKIKSLKIRLSIYGDVIDQEYFHELLNYIQHNNLTDQVTFYSFEIDSIKIYSKIDILLNCSRNEGFGRTIIEAMSFGIPVIANNSGGPKEIITHLNDGILYEQTPESLSEMIELIVSNRKLCNFLCDNAFKKVEENFNNLKYVYSVYELFLKV